MWVFFSILAAFSWSISNIIDKYVLTKWIRKPLIPVIATGAVELVVGIIVYFVHGFSYLSALNIFLAILGGVITISLYIFYFKAMQIEEASRVVPLFYLAPLFISIFAALFLNEIFGPLKYLGIFLLIIGAVLISVKSFLKISFGRAFWWMVLAAAFNAAGALLTKYLLNSADFWTIFGYKCLGMVLASIPIAYFYMADLLGAVKQHGKKVFVAMSASEAITAGGILFAIIAASIGYVTMTNALSSVQPFFVLLITLFLSIFYPRILKEEIGKGLVFQKLVAIVLMFIGVMIIT
jgi:transporter family protein